MIDFFARTGRGCILYGKENFPGEGHMETKVGKQSYLQRLWRTVFYPAPEPIPFTRTFWWATGLVALAALLFAGFYILYLTRLQDAYMTHAEDLGIMDQAIWNTIHGNVLHQTLCNTLTDTNCYQIAGISRFAIHFEPILLPISLLYLIAPTPKTLIVVQTLIVASGAFPAFWLARLRLRNEWIGVVCAVLYLLYPAQQQATTFDFHAVTFTASLLLFTLYFLYTRRTLWLFVFAILAMACKEEIPGIIVMLGLWTIVFQHRWRSGLALIILAFAWLGASLAVVHLFSPTGHSLLISRYAYLGGNAKEILRNVVFHGGTLLKEHVLEHNHMFYLRTLLTPTGYLALLAPWVMILTLPTLLLNLFSTDSQMYSGLYQYSAEIVPFLIFSTIEALWLIQWVVRKLVTYTQNHSIGISTFTWRADARYVQVLQKTGLAVLLTIYLLFSVVRADVSHGVTPFTQGFVWPQSSAHTALAQSFLQQIPPTASISAQTSLVPHISHRAKIYLFPYAAKTADYIFLDVTSDLYPFVNSLDYIRAAKDILLDGQHGVIAAHDGYLLIQRGLAGPGVSPFSMVDPADAPDESVVLPQLPGRFCSFVKTQTKNVTHPVDVTFSQSSPASTGSMNLIGFSAGVPSTLSISAGYLSLTTYWEVSNTIEMPLQQIIMITDKNGHEHLASTDVPSVYWCQTNTWKPRMIVRITSRVFSLRTINLPRGPAHLSFALIPLLQPAKDIMNEEVRLPIRVLQAPKTVTAIPGTNALEVMPMTLES